MAGDVSPVAMFDMSVSLKIQIVNIHLKPKILTISLMSLSETQTLQNVNLRTQRIFEKTLKLLNQISVLESHPNPKSLNRVFLTLSRLLWISQTWDTPSHSANRVLVTLFRLLWVSQPWTPQVTFPTESLWLSPDSYESLRLGYPKSLNLQSLVTFQTHSHKSLPTCTNQVTLSTKPLWLCSTEYFQQS